MAFDGITIHALVDELNNTIKGGRIDKIAQPENDEILLTIKNRSCQYRLMLSANASLPLVYLLSKNKPSPLTAPNFCMLLRKHINNGKITDISQPGFERIIDITIEHLDEMGDMCTRHLCIELMGRHSNIIFMDDNKKIIDSIKRINAGVSSVREVLPGLEYFIPNTTGKLDATIATDSDIMNKIKGSNASVSKAIAAALTGFSTEAAVNICSIAQIDSDLPVKELSETELIHLSHTITNLVDDIIHNDFRPAISYENEIPTHFGVINHDIFAGLKSVEFSSVSKMLEEFYSKKEVSDRIRQRSCDLRQITGTALSRATKKYDLQLKQFEDTKKREQFRLYGELLNAYSYSIQEGAKQAEVLNYYTNENIIIPLEPEYSAAENSRRYFAKYTKLKRTYEALCDQIKTTKAEIDHLESINTALMCATDYETLMEIKQELEDFGFIKKSNNKNQKPNKIKNKPLHYLSSDGFDIFVGKNNIQNEELTFKFASGNDLWFHAKNMPGSHVILKTGGMEVPDRTYEEAAAVAAYYSKGREYEKVEVDYVEKKQLKRVPKAAYGFVIYHTNYSMIVSPDISGLKEIKQ